jgi:23S rRNA (uracil1939-C5)-methyltransferase
LTRKKKELPLLEGVRIEAVAAEGNALARVDDYVVFVPYGAPGDLCDIQLTRKKHHYAEGRILRLAEPSPLRVTPFCRHFGTCGGCKWQHLAYEEQLRAKEQQVVDNLERIGKIHPGERLPILGSAQRQYYRNKLEFTFSSQRWMSWEELRSEEPAVDTPREGLGFHIPGKFDKVLDIDTCYLQAELSNRIRRFTKTFCMEHGYPFFDLRKQEGLMRNLIIRTSEATGEWMLIVVFFRDEPEKRESLLSAVAEAFPEITSLLYAVNGKCNDTLGDQDILLYRGLDHITEEMEGLRFRIGPKSFYQTNSRQAYELYKVVRDFAALSGKELVYDLYTGTGTIANFLARSAARVVGIEYVPEAVEDARRNAALNGLPNTAFFAGDMKDILCESFIAREGRPDVVISDPPRAGMHPDVIRAIRSAAPRRLVYVSCNPATQARDLALLADLYRLEKIQPVDMFPHTQHVENVALLIKN